MLVNVVFLILVVCIFLIFLVVLIGVFVGYFFKVKRFKYRKVLIRIVYILFGLLFVFVGLFIYIFFFRKGFFGFLDMFFIKWVMIIIQVILIVFIVMFYILFGFKNIDRVFENLDYLSVKGCKRYIVIVREYLKEIIYVIVLGFLRVIFEVGGVLIVGGNIEGSIWILIIVIIFEIIKGEFLNVFMFGLVLFVILFIFNIIL